MFKIMFGAQAFLFVYNLLLTIMNKARNQISFSTKCRNDVGYEDWNEL